MTLPGCLLPELAALEQEHAAAMAETYGNGTPDARQIVRMLRPESPTFAALPESCSALDGGFGAVAEQLYGPDIFLAYVEANRYVGDTGWHPDHSANYNAPGCRFAWYLDPLAGNSGGEPQHVIIAVRTHRAPGHYSCANICKPRRHLT